MLSEGGAVVTQTKTGGPSLKTTGTELTEGKHYWEVELLSEDMSGISIGISRPNLNPAGAYFGRECTGGWFINANTGGLCGNGKHFDDYAGEYKKGDSVGVLLDLNDGLLHFFKNGVQNGPGYAAGSVAGPVVAAVVMCLRDSSVRLLRMPKRQPAPECGVQRGAGAGQSNPRTK
jgi:hypothetical protein